MWQGMNRRRFPRANYKCIITLRNFEGAPKIITTNTENIGIGGICVVLKNGVELFRNVKLELFLDNYSPPIKCDGIVVWVVKRTDPAKKETGEYDIGVEFSNINDNDKGRIGDLVEKIQTSE